MRPKIARPNEAHCVYWMNFASNIMFGARKPDARVGTIPLVLVLRSGPWMLRDAKTGRHSGVPVQPVWLASDGKIVRATSEYACRILGTEPYYETTQRRKKKKCRR